MNGRYVYQLADLLGSKHCGAGLPDGRYVRAVSTPFFGGNIHAAWEVLRGRAYAIEWPKPGDLEKALDQ
jgi:hypothetical protein